MITRILAVLAAGAAVTVAGYGQTAFRDDFTSSTLGADWIVTPGGGSYSLTDKPGWLRHTTGAAPALAIDRSFQGKHWALTTSTLAEPGICLSSAQEDLKVSFVGGPWLRWTKQTVHTREGFTWAAVVDTSDGITYTDPTAGPAVYLRITRHGQSLAVAQSSDAGATFQTAFTHIFAADLGYTQTLELTGRESDCTLSADYDFIEVAALPIPGPHPGDIAPVGPEGLYEGNTGQRYGDDKVDILDAIYCLRVFAGLATVP